MQAWFPTDADCLDYLEWLRWPSGFVCSDCGHWGGWRLGDGWFECAGCGQRTSVTAGTIFDRTRTPLTVWFTVVPDGVGDAAPAALGAGAFRAGAVDRDGRGR